MTIAGLVKAIAAKNQAEGFKPYEPATEEEINNFEARVGFALPNDFREFYSVCNGFECEEDMFNFNPLQTIIENGDYGENWFYFAKYMIYSDMWTLKKVGDNFTIVDGSFNTLLTMSLTEFLEHFLQGNVFDVGGLYEWTDALRTMP